MSGTDDGRRDDADQGSVNGADPSGRDGREGETPRVRDFSTVAAGDELPGRTVSLTRADLVRYAGVSGDVNPLHWDDAIAARLGLDGVVAHGMLTMGVGAGYVVDWAGDPGAVREINVRFTSPVFVPPFPASADVELTGKVKSVDDDAQTAVVALTARAAGKKIFGRATASVQLG